MLCNINRERLAFNETVLLNEPRRKEGNKDGGHKAASWTWLLAVVSCAGSMTLWPAKHALAAEAEEPTESGALEAIVVTAQRRAENAQSVPLTVETVSGAEAERRGTTSIMSLGATIPNIAFTTTGLTTNTYIRGVGDNSATSNNESSAAVYVDGVYDPAIMSVASFAFNNIQQIEVLKGPQGTLFGRNATAGVIQIITPDPKHEFSGKVRAGYGNYDTASADAYLTGGLTDKLAADLSVLFLDQMHGYGQDLTTGTPTFRQRDLAARSKWLYEPSDATQIHFAADYAKLNSDGISDQFVPESFPPYPGRYNSYGNPSTNNSKQWGTSVRVDHDFGSLLHGVSITSYREITVDYQIDSDLKPAVLNQVFSHSDSSYVTQELQLTNQNPGRLTWLVGAYFYGNHIFGSDPRIQTGTQVAGGYRQFYGVQDTGSGSVFGQATAELFAATKLTLGLRYTDETLKAFTRTQNVAQQIVAGPFAQELSSHPVTWRVALDHNFAPDVLGYISYNRGFKSGGYNLNSPGSAPFLPEHVDAYEIGAKAEFLDHRVRLNVAGFYYDYTDLQVAVVLGGAQLFENAAAARNYGLDVSLDFAATERLSFSAGLGLLNAKYVNYPGARGYTPLGVPIDLGNAKGADLPFAPPVSGFLSGNYRLPTSIGEFHESVTWSYTDRTFPTPDMGLSRPAYSMVNASVEWRSPSDASFAIRLWGKNLLDEDYDIYASESATGWYRAEGPPRTYGITLEKDF